VTESCNAEIPGISRVAELVATEASLFAVVRVDSTVFGALVDNAASAAGWLRYDGDQSIQQIKAMPACERRKVIRFVASETDRREDESDRAAVTEARRDPRPSIRWEDAKKRLGLK